MLEVGLRETNLNIKKERKKKFIWRRWTPLKSLYNSHTAKSLITNYLNLYGMNSPACVVMDVLQDWISKKRRIWSPKHQGMLQVNVKGISQRNKTQIHKNIQSASFPCRKFRHSVLHPQCWSQFHENFIKAIKSVWRVSKLKKKKTTFKLRPFPNVGVERMRRGFKCVNRRLRLE